jgi:quinol-cytochrome oxidoreductase complex cytochrome b subunit
MQTTLTTEGLDREFVLVLVVLVLVVLVLVVLDWIDRSITRSRTTTRTI